jgi:hypothetical protein
VIEGGREGGREGKDAGMRSCERRHAVHGIIMLDDPVWRVGKWLISI